MRKWEPKANDIFVAAMGIESVDERRQYVINHCGEDVELQRQVASLMEAAAAAGSFLESPLAEPTRIKNPSFLEPSGTVIGPYKLLEPVGEGGMGTVYMAEQSEPVHRKVALKIIKSGMDTNQVIARFEAERQALAVMDHPNIAKVYDAGTTETGRPYFAMELVKGQSITRFCDEHQLDPAHRLKLFMQVCHAVQHAHHKGIIHRDIKPSNVMVAMYDDKAVPKVIDFGVAKATGERLTEKTMFTHYGQVIGTLEYMSPEQAHLNQLDVDTRSDIYSLGAILYELLTGAPPFEKERLKKEALDEILRIIREDEPPKPSTKISSSTTLPRIARSKSEPEKLSALIRGDLDWIVMKALDKDRTRRYETANGLAADIQRHLNSEPVIASPPSAIYRFRKWVRRNKAAFAASVIVAAALIVGLTVASAGFISAIRSRDEAIASKQGEQKQRVAAETAQEEALKQRNEAVKQRNIAAKQVARTRANSILVAASSDNDPLVQALLLKELADIPKMPRRLAVARDVANMPIPMAVLDIDADYLTQRQIALSPDGRFLATVDAKRDEPEGTTRIWRTDGSGEPIILPGTRPSTGRNPHQSMVSFSSDGTHIVTVSQGSVRVLSTNGNGKPIVLQDDDDVLIAKFSPNGNHVLTIAKNGAVRLWRSDGMEDPILFGNNKHRVSAVAFSSDSAKLAIATDEGATRVWPTDGSGTPVVLKGPEGRIDAVAFSPDNVEVAIHHRDDNATIWPEDGALRDKISVWAANGTGKPKVFVRVGSNGGPIQLWQTNNVEVPVALTGYLVPLTLRSPANGRDLAASPDGKLLIDGYWDRKARVFRVDGREKPLELSNGDNRIGSAVFSEDGTVVAIAGDGPVRIWSISGVRTEPLVFRDHQDWVRGVAFSPDGQFVATASYDGTAQIRRADGSGKIVVLPHEAVVMSVNFSPDGKRLLTSCHDGVARIWRVDGTGEPVVFPGASPLEDAEFSPDGTLVVTGSRNGKVQIWNANGQGKPIVLPPLNEPAQSFGRTPLHSVTFSPDGLYVLTGGPWDKAWVRRADGEGTPIELDGNEHMWGGDFSPDGKQIVMGCGDGEVRIWNADGTGEPIVRKEHLDEAFTAEFSPDGTRVVTVSEDGTAHVWWVDGSRETLILRGHGGIVTGAAFSPDGTQVITASKDGTARIWRITWQGLLNHFQANMSACLTPKQRMWYLGESADEAWAKYVKFEQKQGRKPVENLRPR